MNDTLCVCTTYTVVLFSNVKHLEKQMERNISFIVKTIKSHSLIDLLSPSLFFLFPAV